MDDCQLISSSCGPRKDGRHQVCVEFYFAERKKQIVANTDDGGWELLSARPREMSFIAQLVAKKRRQAFIDHSGDPYLLVEICPFCGGELKPVEIQPRKLLGSGDPDC